jgi:hypothetical protein
VIPELKALGKIVAYVHDNDAKAKKAIVTAKWSIQEKLDPGHAFKSFDRKLKKFNAQHGKALSEIEDRLRRFLKDLMYRQDLSAWEKVELWRNAALHFAGDHKHCRIEHNPKRPPKVWSRASDPAAMALLKEFLAKTESVVEHVDGAFSTQMNESINRSKIKFADKDHQWRTTWTARMACAVLDRNAPNWRLMLYDRLNLPPLSPGSRLFLEVRERRRLAEKDWRTSEEFKIERRAQRKRIAAAAKANKVSQSELDYKPSPWKQ